MREVITIGVDLAKNVFQIHGVDAVEAVVVHRQLRRGQVLPFFKKQSSCLVGMEACATAHHWARQLIAFGHEVKLMPPHYVKPYVKRGKTDAADAADAAAICEAVTRIDDRDDLRLPSLARACLESLARQLRSLHEEIGIAEKRIHAWHRANAVSRRLETIPGIGPITASALAASITDPEVFKNGRELAAWIGLVPRQNSSGGKQRLGKISKQGDQYLRWLLVAGAMSVIRQVKRRGTSNQPWLADMVARKPTKVAAVALANKNARIVWALLRHGGTYQMPVIVPAA